MEAELMRTSSLCALVVLSIASVTLFSWWLYPIKQGPKASGLRENSAQLLLHQQKSVDECVSLLARESHSQSVKNLLSEARNPCKRSTIERHSFLLSRQLDIIEMLSDRRALKLFSEIESMDHQTQAGVVFGDFQFLFREHQRTAFEKAFTSLVTAGPRSIAWAMFATARTGANRQLVDEVEIVRLAQRDFLTKLVIDGRIKNPTAAFAQQVYLDNRAVLNCIVTAIVKSKLEGKFAIHIMDLTKSKIAIRSWDGSATLFEASVGLLRIDEPYPQFVQIGNGWEEIIIYDWPDELRKVGREAEQDSRLTKLVEAFRDFVRNEKAPK